MLKTILITRPAPFAATLATQVAALKYNPLSLELVATVPVSSKVGINPTFEINRINLLLAADLIIFISRNSVLHLAELINVYAAYCDANNVLANNDLKVKHISQLLTGKIRIAAVGPSSKLELQKLGATTVISPENSEYSSATLWNILKDMPLAGKVVAIIKGEGGNRVLLDNLQQIAANVTELVVYKRILPAASQMKFAQLLESTKIDIILITCNSSLVHLWQLLQRYSPSNQELDFILQTVTLLVVSNSLKDAALALGFAQVITSANATDAAILEALKIYQV